MLFTKLWPQYEGRLLTATGITLKTLQELILDTAIDDIRKSHIPKTKDFYPDLLITEPQNGRCLMSTLSIDAVLESEKITHLYEFKYLTSFPSLPRKIAREDTYKLKVVGEYIRQATGTIPYMEQFLVTSERPNAQHKTVDALMCWFGDDEIKANTTGVVVSIVGTDGAIHTIDK